MKKAKILMMRANLWELVVLKREGSDFVLYVFDLLKKTSKQRQIVQLSTCTF